MKNFDLSRELFLSWSVYQRNEGDHAEGIVRVLESKPTVTSILP